MHGSYFEYFISHDVETPVAKKCLVSLFIFVRGATDMLFKQSAEVLWILKSQFISHLADSLNTFQYSFFCQFDNPALDIFLCSFSCFLLYQVSEIIRRETCLVCKIFHGWQSFCYCHLILEVFVQQLLEFYDNIFVRLITCDKLPFVETHTVIQQQFDVTHDELLAVLVDRMLQLDPDFMYSISYDFSFLV